MKKRNINLTLPITFDSPFIVGSGFGAAGLIDLKSVKDKDDIVYFPATSLKGKVKAEFKKVMLTIDSGNICNITTNKEICKFDNIKEACVICRIFGSEFYEGSLIFEDAVMDYETHDILSKIETNKIMPQSQSAIRTGIRINRILKTAEDKALFNFETVNPSIVFTSRIHGDVWLTDEEYIFFKKTIESITHLGGNKARGLGRCSIEVNEEVST